MSAHHLTEEIMKRSQSMTWEAAKLEWELHQVYEADTPETCLCGHFPIVEICVLRNRFNNNQVTVGNCCVKKFTTLPSDRIFQAVKRVRRDINKSLNIEAIYHAHKQGWINDWERQFSLDTMHKRDLTMKQREMRRLVNRKMLANMKRNGE